ncbi:hypothetical protein GGR57DRAFT_358985 [Xylariaceae sp. FL1272]|nr:hypothetical protein GGR57DRAFT_358985 [Xylariaceae sp. FL1272]
MPKWQQQGQYDTWGDVSQGTQNLGGDIEESPLSDSGSGGSFFPDDQPELRKDFWLERLRPSFFPVMEMEYRDRKEIPNEVYIKQEYWKEDLEMQQFGRAYHRRSHFCSAHLLTTPQMSYSEVSDINVFIIIIPQWWKQTPRTYRPLHLSLSNAQELGDPLTVTLMPPEARKIHKDEEHLLEEASLMHHFPLDLDKALEKLQEIYSLEEV